MTKNISVLINAVEEADSSYLLLKSVSNLAKTGVPEAIPTLVKVLNYNNPGAAVAAVEGLIKIGETAVPSLLQQLDLQNYTARSWVIRALAGIGDPRGLLVLLGAATADFSPSVRRASAKGIGMIKWHCFPEDIRSIAQEDALESLLFVAQDDEEWVVRYGAIVALQMLANTITQDHPEWIEKIQTQFQQILNQDDSPAVCARIVLAQKIIKGEIVEPPTITIEDTSSSIIKNIDWQLIVEKLYQRKKQEQFVLKEGDPRLYQNLAVSLAKS